MSGKELFDGMSYIDDHFVAEAESQMIKKGSAASWMRWVCAAACLCIMVVGMFIVEDQFPFSAESNDNLYAETDRERTPAGIEDGKTEYPLETYPVSGAGSYIQWNYVSIGQRAELEIAIPEGAERMTLHTNEEAFSYLNGCEMPSSIGNFKIQQKEHTIWIDENGNRIDYMSPLRFDYVSNSDAALYVQAEITAVTEDQLSASEYLFTDEVSEIDHVKISVLDNKRVVLIEVPKKNDHGDITSKQLIAQFITTFEDQHNETHSIMLIVYSDAMDQTSFIELIRELF